MHRILALVTTGNLKPGDRLPGERDLAEEFGISRPTIREAVRALCVLGVLRTRHGGGIFVSALEAADLLGPISFFLKLHDVEVDHLYQARRLIEGEIAALAARSAAPEDIGELTTLIRRQESVVDDPQEYRLVDTEFRKKLAEIAANPFLARAAESLNELGLEFRKMASDTRRLIRGSIRDHKRIVKAISAADPEAARQAMSDHMTQVLKTTKQARTARNGKP